MFRVLESFKGGGLLFWVVFAITSDGFTWVVRRCSPGGIDNMGDISKDSVKNWGILSEGGDAATDLITIFVSDRSATGVAGIWFCKSSATP